MVKTQWLYGPEEMTRLANQSRELIATNLYNEGLIDAETARKITEDYSLLIVEKGYLGRAIDKILGIKDEPVFQMVKLVRAPQQKQEQKNDNNQSEGRA